MRFKADLGNLHVSFDTVVDRSSAQLYDVITLPKRSITCRRLFDAVLQNIPRYPGLLELNLVLVKSSWEPLTCFGFI